MSNKKINFEDFTKLYKLSKTLRFELKPIGKTQENIKHILEEDENRAEDYKKVKKIIDEYHKDFIKRVLSNFCLKYESDGKKNSLEEYLELFNKADKTEDFKVVQDNLRKQISSAFTKNEIHEKIFKEKLFKELLPNFLEGNEENKELIKKFQKFTTYFSGFHENRENVYSSEAKSTAIAYRLIHENLPKFIDNMKTYGEKIKNKIPDGVKSIYDEYSKQKLIDAKSIDEIFSLNYFNKVLTQEQIELYNAIIGGKTEENGQKIQGINECINLYNQKQAEKGDKLPKLKPLFKQILSDREKISWLPEAFANDNELLRDVNEFYRQISDEFTKISKLFKSVRDYDVSKIYIKNDAQLTDLSKKLFGDWSLITEALKTQYEKNTPKKKTQKDEKYEEQKEKHFKSLKSVSIGYLNDCLSPENGDKIQNYFAKLGGSDTERDLISKVENSYKAAENLLKNNYPENRKLVQDKENVRLLKDLLDNVKDLQRFIKLLLGNGDESEKDEKFYGELAPIWEIMDKVTPLYNKVRNYLTCKPYSVEKFKLNFENEKLLNGWDQNKEKDDCCVILRKDGLYYLAIMNKNHKKSFEGELPSNGECYEKMIYKQFDIKKQLPKCTTDLKDVKKELIENGKDSITIPVGKTWNNPITITRELCELNNYVWDKTSGQFEQKEKDDKRPKKFQKKYLQITNDHEGYEKAFDTWVDFTQNFLKSYKGTSHYKITFKKSYESIEDLYQSLNSQLYGISFVDVSVAHINSLVESGKLYLFQIYNKDFSTYSKGIQNMHTLYWKMLFDGKNLADVVYKLNGEAEVFFRKKSIDDNAVIKHPANQPIDNKNNKNSKKQSTFEYELTKNKRFTVDKFQFHVPITLNFKSASSTIINKHIDQYIRDRKDTYFIGIDRGERNLIDYCVIDSYGNIKEQGSLNVIVNSHNGNNYETDYHDLLKKRYEKRTKERQSWESVENIKDLKKGFLGQVIYKISQLILKYKAFVVLEDLNIGFKRGRQKIESSVYQQFEKSLIDKLNYLVDKKEEAAKPGGLLNAYQLTEKFESFQKMGKRNGFLLYIPAWNTSNIDPVTGFVNFFDTRYKNTEDAKDFFSKFDNICYNKEKDWFEFQFDYNNFTSKAEGTRTKWTLCTHGDRIRSNNKQGKWEYEEIENLTNEIKKHLKNFEIDYKAKNLKDLICTQNSKEFFCEMLKLLQLTLQMRNSNSTPGKETDYIISPVANENGNFYDSRKCEKDLPQDADANGAYNIARKGLWVIRRIQNCEEREKLNLAMSNKDWLKFAQEKPYLKD